MFLFILTLFVNLSVLDFGHAQPLGRTRESLIRCFERHESERYPKLLPVSTSISLFFYHNYICCQQSYSTSIVSIVCTSQSYWRNVSRRKKQNRARRMELRKRSARSRHNSNSKRSDTRNTHVMQSRRSKPGICPKIS